MTIDNAQAMNLVSSLNLNWEIFPLIKLAWGCKYIQNNTLFFILADESNPLPVEELHEPTKMECRCGAPQCRKILFG